MRRISESGAVGVDDEEVENSRLPREMTLDLTRVSGVVNVTVEIRFGFSAEFRMEL